MIKPVHKGFRAAWLSLAAVIMISAAAGCRKNTSKDLRPDYNVSNDIVFIERGLFHTFNLLLKANLDSNIMHGDLGVIDNAVVSYSRSSGKFTFNYQDKLCADSATRNGRIVASLTGDFFTSGTGVTVEFQNYSEDSRQFTGSDNLVNNIMSLGGNGGYYSTIVNLTVAKDPAHSTLWNSLLTYHIPVVIKMNPDSLVPFTISGTGNGTSSGTYAFSFEVSTPLLNDIYCPWIRKGIMQVSVPSADAPGGTIEYANNQKCDNRVTYNFEGSVFKGWIISKQLNY